MRIHLLLHIRIIKTKLILSITYTIDIEGPIVQKARPDIWSAR